MNNEYLNLYNRWRETTMFLSVRMYTGPAWETLLNWCKENKKEFKESILEQLKEGPNDIVELLDEICETDKLFKPEGYCPLDLYCSLWIYILDGTFNEKSKDGYIPNYYLPEITDKEIEENRKKLKVEFYKNEQRTTS